MRRANAASTAMLLLLILFISQNHAQASTSPTFTLLLTTNKTTYYPHEDVQATTQLLNGTAPVFGASVTLETMFPNGTTWFVWRNATDENGSAIFTFHLDNCPRGEYAIYATAHLYPLGNASATTTFTMNIPEVPRPKNGTLLVKTTPISAQVFVDAVLWGLSPQNRSLKPGTYTVAYGDVEGFYTPTEEVATVVENSTTTVEGVYQPVESPHVQGNGTLTITTSPVHATAFVNGAIWGVCPQGRSVKPGEYTVSFSAIEGFNTPNNMTATVYENQTTTVEGIYQLMSGTAVIASPNLINNTHPFTINSTEAGVYLKIYSISDPVVIIIRSIAEPEGLAVPESWTMLGDYVQIKVNNTNISLNATLYIHYDEDDLDRAQLEEKALKIHFWNITSNGWSQVETGIDEDVQYAWVNINHFSTWAVMGQSTPSNRTPTWWVWVAVIALFGFLILGLIYDRKKRAVFLFRNRK